VSWITPDCDVVTHAPSVEDKKKERNRQTNKDRDKERGKRKKQK